MMRGLKLFAVLIVGTLLVFLSGQFGPSLVENKLVAKKFQSETLIGTELVENKSRTEAIKELEGAVEAWINEGTIYLEWSGDLSSIDKSVFEFHIEKSVEEAIDGNGNNLIVNLPDSVFLKEVEEVTGGTEMNSEIDLEKLKNDIVSVASKLIKEDQSFSVSDYLLESANGNVTLHEVSIKAEGKLLEELDSVTTIVLNPNGSFSFEEWLTEEGISLSADSGSILASVLYQLALPTNIDIVERHISKELPEWAEAGYESSYNKGVMDLKLFNPNNFPLTIELSRSISNITGSLTGQELPFVYEVIEEKMETYEPKKIVQYSPLVKLNQKQVKEQGKAGVYAVIVRQISDSDGNVMETKQIAQDFYAPIHKVEVHSLSNPVATTPVNANNPSVNTPGSNTDNNTGGTNNGASTGNTNNQGTTNGSNSNNNSSGSTETTNSNGNNSNNNNSGNNDSNDDDDDENDTPGGK